MFTQKEKTHKRTLLLIMLFSMLIGLISPIITPSLWPSFEVQAAAALKTPELISAKANSSSSITVKWNAVDGAEGYRIFRKTDNSQWKKVKTITNSTTLSYKNTKLSMGVKYYYTVRAYKRVNGKLQWSSASKPGVNATTLIPAPKNVTAKPLSTSSITIRWDVVSGTSGYRVYRKQGEEDWVQVTTITGSNITNYTDTKLKTGRKYYYTVRAYKAANNTKVWGKYDKTGVSAVTKIATPKLLSISSSSSTKVTITWEPISGVDGYKIYYTTNGTKWKGLKNIADPSAASYTHKSAVAGIPHTYTVKAYTKDENTVSGCDKKGLTVTPKTAKIKNITAKPLTSTSIKVTWPESKNVDGYRVYRKKANDTSWTKLVTLSGQTTTSHTDTKAEMGVTYYYTVRGYKTVNGSNLWGYYDNTGVKAAIAIPVPELVSAKALDHNQIKVTWKKVEGADGYRIYRRIVNEDSWTRIKTQEGVDKVTYTSTGLQPGTTYFYTVIAYKKIDEKAVLSKYNTEGVSATTKNSPDIPEDENPTLPETFTITAGETKLLTLEGTSQKVIWSVIEQYEGSLKLVPAGNNSVSVNALKPGKAYITAKIDGSSATFTTEITIKGYINADKSTVTLRAGERVEVNVNTNYAVQNISFSSADSSVAGVYRSDYSLQDCAAAIYGKAPGTTTVRIASSSTDPSAYVDIIVVVIEKSTETTGTATLINYLERNGVLADGTRQFKLRYTVFEDIEYQAELSVSYEEASNKFYFKHSKQTDSSFEEVSMNMLSDQTRDIVVQYQYTQGDIAFLAETTINTGDYTGETVPFRLVKSQGLSDEELPKMLEQASRTFDNTFLSWGRTLLAPHVDITMHEFAFTAYTKYKKSS